MKRKVVLDISFLIFKIVHVLNSAAVKMQSLMWLRDLVFCSTMVKR